MAALEGEEQRMADGEKKRFDNFAEFAKARQARAGKEGMPITGAGGPPDSRYMQQGSMGMMGVAPQPSAAMPTPQALQQRGLAPGGLPAMPASMSGIPSMGGQLGRAALGMQGPNQGPSGPSMSSLAMPPRSAVPQSFGSSHQDERSGRMALQAAGGGQSYNPSGEILAMLNKAGGGHGMGAGGYDGAGPPSAAFDPSDFPVLGRGGQGQLGGFDGSDVVGSAALGQQQKEFSMEEDFPALPGAPGGGQAPNNSLMTGGAGAPGMVEQFERMKLENYADAQAVFGGPGLQAQAAAAQADKYGMLGLLSVIRMNNENLTLLALGCDLTQLGLNLNASGDIYDTFNSPWDRSLARKNEEYRLPQCYYISPPALKTAFFQKFTDMTLFYIFYHFLTRPTDQPHQQLRESLVKFAFQELQQRGWQHQGSTNVWVTQTQHTKELKYFDMRAMEIRPWVSGQGAGDGH